ncbi:MULTISPECIES: VOC family protein [Actinomadura]|uniref:Glyoxalase n=1 Tax=Actinomadura litoris TaxID=2678616 RepID=A0A7K1LCU8_9ACTN|nr:MULTISPECIES: VOC family protein [Actinomadura]MBT2208294.1 glyoxalase [Actinomadura sp. NEAU-AAG7]MUN42133.1 glyoxalase [Actinomadura litoris]
MSQGIQTIIFPVTDIARATPIFTALLGAEPVYEESFYVGYRVAGQDIGLDPNGHRKGMTGPVPYVEVEDIEATVAALLAAGARAQDEVKDVGGGKLIATVRDADGNVIGLAQTP